MSRPDLFHLESVEAGKFWICRVTAVRLAPAPEATIGIDASIEGVSSHV